MDIRLDFSLVLEKNLRSGDGMTARDLRIRLRGAEKAALERFTQGLAQEVQEFGVSVTCVSPSQVVPTPGTVHFKLVDSMDDPKGEPPILMARAALLLATEPAAKVNGRVTYSQQILQEFGWISDAIPQDAVKSEFRRLAGKYDLGMLCVSAGVQAGFDALDVNWKVACDLAAEQGREMDRSRLRCVIGVHVAETREQAIADIRFGAEEYVDYLNNNQPRFHVPPGKDTVDWLVENRIAVVGTPDDVIERIEQL